MSESVPPDRWIDDGLVTARELLDPGDRWTETVLHGTGGGAFGSVVVRFESADRAAVVKLVRRNESAPSDPASWRREYEVYRSDWLASRLPTGLGLPRAQDAVLGEHGAVIVLDEVPFDDRDARSAEWYGALATELGRMNGVPAVPDRVPAWLTRRFVADEIATAAELIPPLLADVPSDLISTVEPLRRPLERIAAYPSELIATCDALPHTLHHLDAFSRNAARVGDGYVMIDWSYAGLAPIGADAASTIAITAMHGDVPAGDVGALHDAVVEGYRAGLDAASAPIGAGEVESAIGLLLTIRVARFLTQLHAIDDRPAVAEQVTSRPYGEVFASWVELAHHTLPLAELALPAAGG